jgi:hypothetical protein
VRWNSHRGANSLDDGWVKTCATRRVGPEGLSVFHVVRCCRIQNPKTCYGRKSGHWEYVHFALCGLMKRIPHLRVQSDTSSTECAFYDLFQNIRVLLPVKRFVGSFGENHRCERVQCGDSLADVHPQVSKHYGEEAGSRCENRKGIGE